MAKLGFGGKNIVDIIKYRFVWLGISAVFIIPCLFFMGYNMMNLPTHSPVRLGIDFTGGTFLQYAFEKKMEVKDIGEIRKVLAEVDQGNAIIQIQEPADILGSLSSAKSSGGSEEVEAPQNEKVEDASDVDKSDKKADSKDSEEKEVKKDQKQEEKAESKEAKTSDKETKVDDKESKEKVDKEKETAKEDKLAEEATEEQTLTKEEAQANAEEDSVATTSKNLDMSNVHTIVSLRVKFLNDKELKELNAVLRKNLGDFSILQVSAIGPSLGKELLHNAMMALLLVFGGIVVYLSMRFQLDYAICALITLFHDAIFVMGAFALFSIFFNTEVDSLFVTAVLTVIGFSVHDTIVVFDRIRENARFLSKKKTFNEICNDSVNQTIARSVNTSVTTIIVLLCLFFFGGVTTKDFVLAMALGIAVGTYSSIFFAAMLLAFWRDLNAPKKRKRKVSAE